MKRILEFFKDEKAQQNRIAFQGGAYSMTITVIVLAIMIVINILASSLPVTLTKYDISSSQLYSITSNTKVVVNALEEDVTIYWIVQADMEDDVIENLLAKYESLSSHIKVVKKNPDAFPTFVEQYTDEDAPNNSLIVECNDRSRFISYDDIYLQEMDMYSYSYNTSFDGEGAITSAIDYVTNEDQPHLYLLEGHGEGELPSTISDQITKENIETAELSLLTVDEMPEDADCIMIYTPSSDISDKEMEMLEDYVSSGGKLLVISGPGETQLTNLNSILNTYSVSVNDGIVIEGDREYYAFGYPYILLPEMTSSELTDSLIEEKYSVIIPVSGSLTVNGDSAEGTVTSILTTSAASYSKAEGVNMTSYEQEEDDEKGPFTLAVSIDDNSGGRIIWFASSYFVEDMYNSYSSGANGDLAMNALSSMIGESEAVAIRSKSLNYSYLTISDSTASLLKVIMIGICPLVYLGIGISIVMRRRRKQNEPV